jgi:nucleoside phosphorylase
MPPAKTLSHDDYTVGWICALPLEMAAAKVMLDEVHTKLPQPRHDHNTYVLGEIAGHNVVIACLPSGVYGTTLAAVVAEQMLSTFHSIRFGLMVGIGGGVPSLSADIQLRDVVVSKPTGSLGGVVQYDYGKTIAEGHFQRTGTLSKPPQVLLTALSHLESNHMIGMSQFPTYLSDAMEQNEYVQSTFSYPG